MNKNVENLSKLELLEDDNGVESQHVQTESTKCETNEVEYWKPSAMTCVEQHIERYKDPFMSSLRNLILRKEQFSSSAYLRSDANFIRAFEKKKIVLGDDEYQLGKLLGVGGYGRVYSAKKIADSSYMALKLQEHDSGLWELYVSTQIMKRVSANQRHFFQEMNTAMFSPTQSILVNEMAVYGCLYDSFSLNRFKATVKNTVLLAKHYSSQILEIIDILHGHQFIHADLKPNNLLVVKDQNVGLHLKLIDYGNSIDMTQFKPDVTFNAHCAAENFTCTEMELGKPWTYQVDYYCVAACIYFLFYRRKLNVIQKNGAWLPVFSPSDLYSELLSPIFKALLNVSFEHRPNLLTLKKIMDSNLAEHAAELRQALCDYERFLSN